MSKFCLVAALVALAAAANAQETLVPGDPITVDGLTLSLSDPVPVGENGGLFSVTLSVTNSGGELISSFVGSIGNDRSLHHEQFICGHPFHCFSSSPTALTSASSTVDSHFLARFDGEADPSNRPVEQSGFPGVAINAPLGMNDFEGILSGEPGDFSAGGFVGFGPSLLGDFSFASENIAASVDLAQLVLSFENPTTDFDFVIGTETPGVSVAFSGRLGVVPEPSAAWLVGLGLAGFVARRR